MAKTERYRPDDMDPQMREKKDSSPSGIVAARALHPTIHQLCNGVTGQPSLAQIQMWVADVLQGSNSDLVWELLICGSCNKGGSCIESPLHGQQGNALKQGWELHQGITARSARGCAECLACAWHALGTAKSAGQLAAVELAWLRVIVSRLGSYS